MSVEKYETLGRVILERAGFSGEERLLDKAIGLSTEKQTNAILAVIASELEQIRYLLFSPRAESSAGIPSFPWRNKVVKDDSVDYVADGFLHWCRCSNGDVSISDLDTSALSVRARKVLMRSKFKFLSEISESNLEGRKGCGASTLKELLNWASAQR